MLHSEARYEPCTGSLFLSRPPYMTLGGGNENWGKIVEALLEMRVMSGSEQNHGMDEKTLNGMISYIEDDGLMYSVAEGRPWHSTIYPEEFANLHHQGRAMLALMAAQQLYPQPELKRLIKTLADGLASVAVFKDDYAYYPESDLGGALSYPRAGWRHTKEPGEWSIYRPTWQGSADRILLSEGAMIRALCRWYRMSGDEEAFDFATKLVNHIRQRRLWLTDVDPVTVLGSEHAPYIGHIHSHMCGLWGLLDYAMITNDAKLKDFVRQGYEYTRNYGIARIGLFGEGCGVGGMVSLAVRLSDAGVGDYWEDVDQYARNHLVELQFLRKDLLDAISEAGPETPEDKVSPPDGSIASTDNVIQRCLGSITVDASHVTGTHAKFGICCQGNVLAAFYRVWDSIVRCEGGVAQVNLLLNRASPWLDVDSYLPYEGKVVIRNKSARKLSLRVPRWVDKQAIKCSINGGPASPILVGNYLFFEALGAKDTVAVEFPVVETTEVHMNGWEGIPWLREGWKGNCHTEVTSPTWYKPPEERTEYKLHFRGNTLVDVSPRADNPAAYPIYLRDHLKAGVAPMRSVSRFLSAKAIRW